MAIGTVVVLLPGIYAGSLVNTLFAKFPERITRHPKVVVDGLRGWFKRVHMFFLCSNYTI